MYVITVLLFQGFNTLLCINNQYMNLLRIADFRLHVDNVNEEGKNVEELPTGCEHYYYPLLYRFFREKKEEE